MRARKVDRTQKAIVGALRRSGALVWVVNGTLDLVCQFAGAQTILEVKAKGGRMTKTQQAMREAGWRFEIVENTLQAYEAVGIPLRMRR